MGIASKLRDAYLWHRDCSDVINASAVVWCGASTNIGNAYSVTVPLQPDGSILPLDDGMSVRFIASATNTSNSTLNVNTTGAHPIRNRDGTATSSGAMVIGQIQEVVYVVSSSPGWYLLN